MVDSEQRWAIWLDDTRDPDGPFKGDESIGLSWKEVVYFANNISSDVNLIWCKNSNDFIRALNISSSMPELICFDHDLGDDSMSGYECLKHICGKIMASCHRPDKIFKCISQSDNPVGRENILSYYNNFCKVYLNQ